MVVIVKWPMARRVNQAKKRPTSTKFLRTKMEPQSIPIDCAQAQGPAFYFH